MAKFNGVYSYRAGCRGARKSTSAININSDFWTCAEGHRNPNFELVDDRAKGGFVHREKVSACKQCISVTSQERFILSKCDRCGKATTKKNHNDAEGLYVLPHEWGEPLADRGAFCEACCALPKENWIAWYAAQPLRAVDAEVGRFVAQGE